MDVVVRDCMFSVLSVGSGFVQRKRDVGSVHSVLIIPVISWKKSGVCSLDSQLVV